MAVPLLGGEPAQFADTTVQGYTSCVAYFDEIGGESALRAIIDEFVERVFADTMIGFLFARANRARIKRFEYEHAAAFLGAPVAYTGQDLAAAHRRHPIMGGHFGRRRQILKQTLERHGVPPHIRDAWLAHQDALREQVTTDLVSQCTDQSNRGGREGGGG